MTINGRVPTPTGRTIPIPTPWRGGVTNIDKLLKPVEAPGTPPLLSIEEQEALKEEAQRVGAPINIDLMLRPVVNGG